MTITQQIAVLLQKLATLINSRPITMKGEQIYKVAAANLGRHLTLNDAVPAEVGCAEAVSWVLAKAGISDGVKGIAGTAALDAWLTSSPLFTKIVMPEDGAILVSATGAGNGSVEGHTGVFGRYDVEYVGDWGILSNESATGRFMERWSWARWQAYYKNAGGLPCNIYRAI